MIYRIDKLVELCRGKTVLHLGFVQHSRYRDQMVQGKWLHEKIASVAKHVVGIDILEDAVADLRDNEGYEAYVGNVEKLSDVNLDQTFDIVLAGELIEHLANPGLLLEGVARFMRDDSRLILTTPNSFGKLYQSNLKKKEEKYWVNEEHVMWFSKYTLQRLLERYGFKEVEYGYYFGFETLESDIKSENSMVRRLKLLRRRITHSRTPKEKSMGLFFLSEKA